MLSLMSPCVMPLIYQPHNLFYQPTGPTRALRQYGTELSVLPHLLHRGPRASASGGAACGEAAAAGVGVGRTVADQVGSAIGAL